MYNLNVTPQFKRDANKCKRQGKRMELLWEAARILINEGAEKHLFLLF